MGVPKFFRWISERYPNLSVNIDNNQMPEFDCLYLDMNGIIHICSHPDDGNVHFRISEGEIFNNIFKYIDFLFKTVKPKEVFYLAVDGVAPRAKMNQQRCRRFKSAKECKDRENAAVLNGVVLPTEKKFDSNAITPGTEFMDRLQQALKTFLSNKVETDNLWHGVDVILSGHETPGEGEHKIQEYIRYKRSLPNYNPNTRHCLYGLDADLMLLGLASHEPYFSLLREEVTFSPKSKGRRAYIAEETKFFLLHLSLLRDYIDYEFNSLKSVLGAEYDLERVIDDWVVLSFLVGNDFVPHLPNLHIHMSALPLLWQTYIKVRPIMKGYINEHGHLNLGNLLTYIIELSSFDHKHFEEMFDDMKWMFGKTGQKMAKELDNLDKKTLNNGNIVTEKNLIDFDETETEEESALIDDIQKDSSDDIDRNSLNIDENDNGDGIWEMQFHAHKTEYYYSKLGLKSSPEVLIDQAKEYFTALQWISYYYFSGVPSWSWFYPQHYAPFVSDLNCLSDDILENGISFELGKPFLPFEQLMAVLPSDSSELLPDCFNILMTMENSPIIDFYPKTFKTDLNGKKREWEAVILIPFIEEKRLLTSLEKHKYLLNPDETRRNVHGPHIKFRFSQKKLSVTEIDPALFRIARNEIVFGLCPNVQLDVICQGFPTFRHVAHTFVLERAFVRVFENHSTFESMVLKITPSKIQITAESVAINFLQKLAYVNWPAFILSKVVAVLDKENRITLDHITKQLVKTPLEEKEARKMKEFIATEPQDLYKRRAVTLDLSNMIVLETLHSEGNVYEIVSSHKAGCRIHLERNWVDSKLHWHLHQLSVLHEDIEIVKREESHACTKLSQLFPTGGLVFCLDSQHYAVNGKIQSINNCKGSISVKLDQLTEPEYNGVDLNETGVEYMTAVQASEYLDMDAHLLSKITGSIFINMTRGGFESKHKQKSCRKDRHSIGLDLKNNKLNLQVPGWVMKSNGSDNGTAKWLYSMKVVQILDDYREKFPLIFEFIKKPNFEALTMEDVFEAGGDMKLLERKYEELKNYLENLEYRTVEKLSNDHKLLTEIQIKKLEHFIDSENYNGKVSKISEEVELAFKDLYRPHHSLHGTKPDLTTEYRLLDRVVCCTEDYTVPLGLRGVVIGIEPFGNDDQIKLEVLFDKEFKSAIVIRGSQPRCYRMPPFTLINTSYGIRKFHGDHVTDGKKETVVDGNTSNSNYNHQTTDSMPLKKAQDKLTVATPTPINQSLSSDLLTALFSDISIELPPMPPKKYSENVTRKKTTNVAISEHCKTPPATKIEPPNRKQMDFLVHCDNLFKNTATAAEVTPAPKTTSFSTVINITNCPEEYKALFQMCVECGVVNPTVIERHVNEDIMMSFKCNHLDMPEFREKNLAVGRLNHVNRVWHCLYSLQQQQQQPLPRPYMPPQFLHYYVPPQFQENPFTELYPSSSPSALVQSPKTWGENNNRQQQQTKKKTKTMESCAERESRMVCKENGDKVIVNNQHYTVTKKKFIKAPKTKLKFPGQNNNDNKL